MPRGLTRRALLACGAALAAAPAFARDMAPFDAAAFDAAVKSGAPVLVHVGAPWCPICRAQKPILTALLDEPRFASMVAFEIDFDGRKDDVRLVGARHQSTLIVYGGGKEVARSVGQPQKEWIEDLLETAVKPRPAG